MERGYDLGSDFATITFPGLPNGLLPDGNYRATLSASGVTDRAGNALAGGNAVLDFFVLSGDINRDRSVNGSDFAILAGNFGRTLPPPAAGPAAASAPAATREPAVSSMAPTPAPAPARPAPLRHAVSRLQSAKKPQRRTAVTVP
jgi:hypothetical protein